MNYLYMAIAAVCAFCISISLTPVIRTIAYKYNVTDVPKDNRRMHKKEMPLMGGLAIFLAFVASVLIFCDIDKRVVGMLIGALLIVITGIIDDKFDLNAFIKLFMQIAAAVIAVASGITIDHVNIFGNVINFGAWSWVVSVIWIVALTNAINLIDGLDGLSCGISAIASTTLLLSLLNTYTDMNIIIMTAILAGSCLGFLPFNFNPARIFMGDTGALFLGYTMSVLSIFGLFKLNAIVSLWVPFLVFALPIVDTAFAFIRRMLKGQSPFSPDRGHLHHRLIDRGFDQKHAVLILYAISAISGVSAILITFEKFIPAVAIVVVALVVLFLNMKFSSEKKDEKLAIEQRNENLMNPVEQSDEENISDSENKES